MKNTIALENIDSMNKESTISYLRLMYKDVIALNNGWYLVSENSNFSDMNTASQYGYNQNKVIVRLLDKELHEIAKMSGYEPGEDLELSSILDYSTGLEMFILYRYENNSRKALNMIFQDGRVLNVDYLGLGKNILLDSLHSIIDEQTDNKDVGLYQLDTFVKTNGFKMNYSSGMLIHVNNEQNPDGTNKYTVCDTDMQDCYKFLSLDDKDDRHLLILTAPGYKVIDYNIENNLIESVVATDYNKYENIEKVIWAFLKDHENIVRHTNDMVGQLGDTYISNKNKLVGHRDTLVRLLADETSNSFEMLDIDNRVCMTDKKNIAASEDSLLMPFNEYILSVGNENVQNMDEYNLIDKHGKPAITVEEEYDTASASDRDWLSLAGTDYYIRKTQAMYIYNNSRYTTDRRIEIYKNIDNKLVKMYEASKNYSELYKISKESSFTLVNGQVAFVMHMSNAGMRDIVSGFQIFYPELSLIANYKVIDDSVEDVMLDSLDGSVNGSKSVDYKAYEAYRIAGLNDFGEPDIEDYDTCGLAGYGIKYFNTAGTMLSTDRIGIKAYNTDAMGAVIDFGNLENEIISRVSKQ